MRSLRDINAHILDMSKSTWEDETGAEKSLDVATWNKDVRVILEKDLQLKTKVYYDAHSKPKHWLWWCRWDPPKNIEYKTAKNTLPASAVTVDRDPYWPEGMEPSAQGFFIHGDLILMKRPYVDHLKDEISRLKRSKVGAKSAMDEFKELAKREGAGLTDQEQEALGSQI